MGAAGNPRLHLTQAGITGKLMRGQRDWLATVPRLQRGVAELISRWVGQSTRH
jgi:hypothetical protein